MNSIFVHELYLGMCKNTYLGHNQVAVLGISYPPPHTQCAGTYEPGLFIDEDQFSEDLGANASRVQEQAAPASWERPN